MKYLIAIFVMFFVFGIVWLNKFTTLGSGADKDSPDGRYRVSAGNYLERSFTQGQSAYVKIEITHISTNEKIWNLTRYLNNGETATDFRSNNLTNWAVDSKSVSVVISSAETLVIPLP